MKAAQKMFLSILSLEQIRHHEHAEHEVLIFMFQQNNARHIATRSERVNYLRIRNLQFLIQIVRVFLLFPLASDTHVTQANVRERKFIKFL